MTCPFCPPDPTRLLFSTDQVHALWDAFPVTAGHALVVPHRHIASWFDATESERAALTAALDKVRDAVRELHGPVDAFNIGINVGEAAGQTVPHLHVHLIPRRKGDVPDPRGGIRHVIPGKGNYLADPNPKLLSSGGSDPVLPHLELDLERATKVDVAVAFVMNSGLDTLELGLAKLLERGGHLRLVTGDYLDVTDPDALRRLHDLKLRFGERVGLRVFVSGGRTSFHPKSYIFIDDASGGVAYVGSSNLSKTALQSGVEWNYRVVTSRDQGGFQQVVSAFESLYAHPSTQPIDAEWIQAYRARRKPSAAAASMQVDVEAEAPLAVPKPHGVQVEALAALEATRRAGNRAGLVVMATGLGKTWLSAYDSNRPEFQRILFVAHRDEILTQAASSFRRIRPTSTFGFYNGGEKVPHADIVFASIQTLGKRAHLDQFARDAFDYVVVDEFHHALAKTYRNLISHFEPKFLLGLTATPDRTDGGDLLQLCQENLVYWCDLVRGINEDLLSPFHYFGVPDEVDYKQIPWRSTRFDEAALEEAVATTKRAHNTHEQWKKHGGTRTLAFCVSQRHAVFMRSFFRDRGVRCAAVFAGPESDARQASVEDLRTGKLQVLFAVDMFNEGVDVPDIDTVMMLRPTESQIVWLQQLGRGLRLREGKTLKVVDYIGNHRTFLMKAKALLRLPDADDGQLKLAIEELRSGPWRDLPKGCDITYDLKALDILQGLLRLSKQGDAIRQFYEDFVLRNGERPTASEAYHAGYDPKQCRRTFGSWFGFVKAMKGLDAGQLETFEAHREFFEVFDTTPMTKSYKMLVVLGLLNANAIPGDGLTVEALAAEFRRAAQWSSKLVADVGTETLLDDAKLTALLTKNPIDAWTGGRGTAGNPFFELSGGRFRFSRQVPASQREAFQKLLRELTDWRLAEYLDRPEEVPVTSSGTFDAVVGDAGGQPVIKLPDRTKAPVIPYGWTTLEVDGQPYEANFAQREVNVVRKPGTTANDLPSILRKWFGHDAGMPGTQYLVACERVGEQYRMLPKKKGSDGQKLQLWASYSREQIPALFGLTFSEAIWNSGFVANEKGIFLLVTLQKGQMLPGHKYADRFLSPSQFEWQSQNRTRQGDKHGQLIKNHAGKGLQVHLFVRNDKKLAGGRSAPFVYCGDVTFESWKGEKPITVIWKLPQPVPPNLQARFGSTAELRFPDRET